LAETLLRKIRRGKTQ